MADEWKEVAGAALDVFKDSLKGVVDNEQVNEFAKDQIKLYAQEWWAAKKASSDAERQEHEANLKHLTAQARGEARRLQIVISEEAKDSVGRALEMVGNFLLKMAPKLLAPVI